MSETQVTPPPLRTPLVDQRGMVTSGAWTQFFTNFFLRSGGIKAPDIGALATEVTQAEQNITTLQHDLSTTQTTLGAVQADVNALSGTVTQPYEIGWSSDQDMLAQLVRLQRRVASLELFALMGL